MEAKLKAILVSVIAGGVLIAAFYVAYLFLLLVVLGGVGFLAYLYFNKDDIFNKHDFYD